MTSYQVQSLETLKNDYNVFIDLGLYYVRVSDCSVACRYEIIILISYVP